MIWLKKSINRLEHKPPCSPPPRSASPPRPPLSAVSTICAWEAGFLNKKPQTIVHTHLNWSHFHFLTSLADTLDPDCGVQPQRRGLARGGDGAAAGLQVQGGGGGQFWAKKTTHYFQ